MYLFTKYFHCINLPPLLAITVFFIVGILLHAAEWLCIAVFCAIIGIILFSYYKKTPLPTQLLFCSFALVAGAYLHNKDLRDYDDFYILIDGKPITIAGTIIDTSEATTHYKESDVLTLSLASLNNTHFINNKVIMIYTKKETTIAVGDTVTFFNVRCKKPNSESFQRYQIKEQIVSTVFENNPRYIINNHPEWSLRRWIWDQKKRLLQSLSTKLSENGFRFFSSLFLGNRACVKATLEETNEQFKTWGISHFLARSGLHLALFIFIWQAIFCIIPLPLIIKQFIICLLSFIYFILTWTSAPFTRSFALFILNKVCLFTRTPFHLLHYLTLVCFGFLLYCPLYLFFLDFQLSFALTFALAWFSQLSNQYN